MSSAVTKGKRSIGSNWSFDVDIYIGDSTSSSSLTWAITKLQPRQSYSHPDLNAVTARRPQQKIIVITMFILNCTPEAYGPPIERPRLKHQQTQDVIGTLRGVMATFIHPIPRPQQAKCMQTTTITTRRKIPGKITSRKRPFQRL